VAETPAAKGGQQDLHVLDIRIPLVETILCAVQQANKMREP
jgi:hypothetical protein